MRRGKVAHIRNVSSTALIYCEGAHDLAFLRYLILTYTAARVTKTKFRTKQGKGGSPDTLMVEAIHTPGAFDRKLVKVDKDRTSEEIERAETLAVQYSIVIVWSMPCLEALLLSVIDGKDYSDKKSKSCKQIFEAKHIRASRRTDRREYAKIYTFEVLEDARKRLPELDALIKFISV
jgi:hypothetical protein